VDGPGHFMFYVYLIQSKKDKSVYIGFSKNLRQRVKDHNNGKVTFTKNRRPYKLIYYEAYLNEKDAEKRERNLKNKGGQRDFMKENLLHSLIR